MGAMQSYFDTLVQRFGEGWNRFWFTPSDPFTLGVIRFLTGVVALGLYLSYIPDLEFWFGPDGILPENSILRLRPAPIFSMFDYANSTAMLWILFWAGAVAIAVFAVGVLTRVTAVFALLAMLSILHRGPVLARPVDDIVSMVMFYLCIAPAGATVSFDAWWNRPKSPPTRDSSAATQLSWVPTVATRLMQVHVSAIYFLMALAKLRTFRPVWWYGTAVWGLIAKPESRVVDLTGLAGAPYIINVWTLAIVLFELCFAFLIWNRLARPLLLALAVPIWFGTGLLTGMTSWALMMLVANLAFASPAFLRNCLSRRTTTTGQLTGGNKGNGV
jgi:hypothetical protein